jgi:2,3,4,5-tetrahydropyridine-2-carboxylate N-succinyltransferase
VKEDIERLWESPSEEGLATVDEVLRLLDEGEIRVAEPGPEGWTVNEWVKKAILLAFRLRRVEPVECGPFAYLDKLPLKRDYAMSTSREASASAASSSRSRRAL